MPGTQPRTAVFRGPAAGPQLCHHWGVPSSWQDPAAHEKLPSDLPRDVRRALRLLAGVERGIPELAALPADERKRDLIVERRGAKGSLAIPRPSITGPLLPAAERVSLGRPADKLVRLRAFYPALDLTLAVHGSLPPWRRSRLLAGSRLQGHLAHRTAFRIPAPIRRGRRLDHAWVLEEHVPGDPYSVDAFRDVAPTLAEGIAGTWDESATRRLPVRALVTDEVLAILRDMVDSLEGAYPRARRVVAAVESLASAADDLILGLCHGDPVRSNWLAHAASPPALVDWEYAGPRPAGADLMKLVVGLPDPAAVLAHVRTAVFSGPRVAPLNVQVAAPTAAWLARWPADRATAYRSGARDAYRLRVRQRLDLLDALLA